jgi:lysozyme
MGEWKISNEGIEFLKAREGCVLNAYPDPSTSTTNFAIGYGSSKMPNGEKVRPGHTITEAQSIELLKKRLDEEFEPTVRSEIANVQGLKQCQYDALVSFCYNVGVANFKKSTLLKKVKANPDDPNIAYEFMKWITSEGKIINGLVYRREWEVILYFDRDPSNSGIDTQAYINGQIPTVSTQQPVIQPKQNYKLHISKIYEINNDKIFGNLFCHPFYYAQNEGKNNDLINKRKALLWLFTLPFDYNKLIEYNQKLLGKKSNGNIIGFPYGYLVFLGGLLWRERYQKNNKVSDVFIYPEGYNKNSNFFLYKDSDKYRGVVISKEESTTTNTRSYQFIHNEADYYITNYLINLFENFVKGDWLQVKNHCELVIIVNKTAKIMQYSDCLKLCNDGYEYSQNKDNIKTYKSFLECLVGSRELPYNNKGDSYKIGNFLGNYVAAIPENYELMRMYYSDTNIISNIFCNLLGNMSITLLSTYQTKSYITKLNIKLEDVTTYLQSFVTEIVDLCKDEEKYLKISQSINSQKNKEERDFLVEIYMYLRNIWNRWLCGYYNSANDMDGGYKNTFDVKSYFTNNFIFIDSFYRNIFQKLKLNCETLSDKISRYTDNVSLYTYLGGIASDHRCMFLSLPDYINLGDSNNTVAMENMKDIFKPIPVSKITNPRDQNFFVCIYTHELSSMTTQEKSDFRPDNFDIWSEEHGVNIAPPTFKHGCEPDNVDMYKDDDKNSPDYKYGQMNRYGYNVPAFGVAYSRQNNHIFKNISASMNNPIMTEQAMKAMGAIAEQGNSSAKKVTFYGQDIYPIYSNYSYIVEIEMMGNAQIQPLMYFQLMNVPMFRGTYMVIKVSHNITQGNMTTKITGTKMSKYATPFTSNWFLVNIPDEEGENNNTDTSNTLINSFTTLETSQTPQDVELQQNRENILYIMNRLINEGVVYNNKTYKFNVYQASIICSTMDCVSKCNPQYINEKTSGQGIRGWKIKSSLFQKHFDKFKNMINTQMVNYYKHNILHSLSKNYNLFSQEDKEIVNKPLDEQYDFMIYQMIEFYPDLFSEDSGNPHTIFSDYFNEWDENFDNESNIDAIITGLFHINKYYVVMDNYPKDYLPYVRKCYDLWQSQKKES